MNHKQIEKVKVLFEEDINCEIQDIGILVFYNDGLSSGAHDIPIEHIHHIELSMCSVSSSLKFQFLYHVDVIISTHDEKVYYFEVIYDDSILKIISWIKEHHIAFIDKLGIEDIFTCYTDQVERWKYINRHFHTWAKTYHLDNPRDNHAKELCDEIKSAFQETWRVLRK